MSKEPCSALIYWLCGYQDKRGGLARNRRHQEGLETLHLLAHLGRHDKERAAPRLYTIAARSIA